MLDGLVSQLLSEFTQNEFSGGCHTPPEARLMFLFLSRMIRAEKIIETGYDAGYTTLALGLSGYEVVGVDNNSEYPGVKDGAAKLTAPYPNIKLIQTEAGEHLKQCPPDSVGLIFVDDLHEPGHVSRECAHIRRILRSGGLAIFHDTVAHHLEEVVRREFPKWDMLFLPCYSPIAKDDFGIGIVKKP